VGGSKMENEGIIFINGYSLEIYRNDSNDVVIKQPDFYEEEVVIIIGKEQVAAVIKALRSLPFLD
jgi:hypothetical protein